MLTKGGVDLSVCSYCSTPIDESSRTVDHLTPKSRGGKLSNKNKVPACKKCNELKRNMDLKEFELAVSAMIFLENMNHNERISYLKRLSFNIKKIKERL